MHRPSHYRMVWVCHAFVAVTRVREAQKRRLAERKEAMLRDEAAFATVLDAVSPTDKDRAALASRARYVQCFCTV